MTKEKTLNCLRINESGIVKEIHRSSAAKRRFLDLGIIHGTKVTALYKSPYNDPVAFLIRGAVIALRSEDCAGIVIY